MKRSSKLMLGTLALGGLAAVAFLTRRKDTASITLKENLVNGYLWIYEMDKKNVVEEYRTNYTPSADEQNPETYGKHKWTFSPVAAGETVITFKYAKPWENNSVACKAEYLFKVDSNKKISIELLNADDNFNELLIHAG